MKYYFILLCLTVLACSTPKSDPNPVGSFHKAVAVTNESIVHDVFSPPAASRVYVYPAIAAYEAAILGNNDYLSLKDQLNGEFNIDPTNINQQNIELTSTLAYLYTARRLVFTKNFIDDYINVLKQKYSDDVFETSSADAEYVTEAIMDWASRDNYAQTRSLPKYDVTKTDVKNGQWIPTPPNYMEPIEPHWSQIRTFVLDSSEQFQPVAPPAYSLEEGSVFHNDLIELYDSTKSLTEEQVLIAEFWDCNPFVMTNKGHNMSSYKKITPGGHWVCIAGIAAETKGADFAETVSIYTGTCIAIADGFISCWDEKYRSNLIRPETVINFNLDPDWKPALQTPPFPEYTSGHSVVSGAAATVLTDMVGENFFFSDTTEVIYGLPVRNFSSFMEASKEAAISRFYGGIHYRPAIENGLSQGIKVGEFISNNLTLKNE